MKIQRFKTFCKAKNTLILHRENVKNKIKPTLLHVDFVYSLALLHEKIANQRKDYIHKQSRQIANAYDLVCVEDLNMQGMSQALNFGKSVSDNAWGMFLRFLDYKLTEQGKMLVKIDKWFPSSKTCHKCGYVLEELSLIIRKWECPV